MRVNGSRETSWQVIEETRGEGRMAQMEAEVEERVIFRKQSQWDWLVG